jgi:hypothetical protein
LADLRILQLDARLHREMGGGSGGEVGQERDRRGEFTSVIPESILRKLKPEPSEPVDTMS